MLLFTRFQSRAVLFGLLLPAFLWAQPKSMKWGEVPRSDLEMKIFPNDTNAAAVILADYGEVYFDRSFNASTSKVRGVDLPSNTPTRFYQRINIASDDEMVFIRHRRIKILSAAGYEWGSHSIRFDAKEDRQRVSDVEGQTYYLAADGAVLQEKLDKKALFAEGVEGSTRQIRFTLPNLRPGCIVEYRYKIISKGERFLPDWVFQMSEPVRWSEFRVAIPTDQRLANLNMPMVKLVIIKQGIPSLAVEETWTGREEERIQGVNVPGLGSFQTWNEHHRWAMREVPALREEPFITTIEDYRAKIIFPSALQQRPEDAIDTWEKLATELMESPRFGGQIGRHEVLRRQAETVTAGLSDSEQKMRAIYDDVRKSIAWDERRGIYAGDLDKAFQARRGGGPEIALMLISMLRAAELEAHPVLISTRDHGKIIEAYPNLRQFNHVLTYVKSGEREYLLDATDPLRPYNLLPLAALNNVGWLVEKKVPRWVDIVAPEGAGTQIIVSAQLTTDGVLNCWFQTSAGGYSGLSQRRSLQEKKDDEFIRSEWLAGLIGAKLDSFEISRKDSTHLPLIAKASFSTAAHVQVAGDKIYFNPILFNRREENPFKQPERTFPVDFGYGSKDVYALYLTLPEGCTVQELPKNVALALPNDGGQFRRVVQVEGNQLQLMSQMILRKPRFEPEEYKALREFYDRIVAAHAEHIVLKRDGAN
jgi:hypothetical protein